MSHYFFFFFFFCRNDFALFLLRDWRISIIYKFERKELEQWILTIFLGMDLIFSLRISVDPH